MASSMPKILGIASLAFGVVVYLGAVAGVFFDGNTPPLDVGAVSFLLMGVLFGLCGLALARMPA